MALNQARRVAAAWGRKVAMSGWNPPIPAELLILAYTQETEEGQLLSDAKDSLGSLLPKILELLYKTQGDRYYMNASESHGKIFYYFAPRQPVDAFNLTLWIKGDMAYLSFGYMPYKVTGGLDLQNMKTERTSIEPDLTGMAAIRLVRNLLGKLQ